MRRIFVIFAIGLLLTGAAACEPAPSSSGSGGKQFGTAITPWDVDTWTSKVGAHPTSVLMFEQFAQNRPLDKQFTEARAQHFRSVMVTWEPWTQVPASKGKAAQYAVQPQWSNATIASGKVDTYIKMFAKSVRAAGLTVYIRYAHEMNGDWYPWSHDPANYIKAWRHVFNVFKAEKVTNARFVFSMNPNIYQSNADFFKGVVPYWPGSGYVNYIGATMINFGGSKNYSVAQFKARLELMHSMLPKSLYIAEVQTAYTGRVQWFTDLRNWLASPSASWIVGMNLSQYGSRIETQSGGTVGNLDWTVDNDSATKPIIRSIIASTT